MSDDHAREPTRERLLGAALEVLASDGIAGFTHRRIEDRAGVTHGSTKYHFGTREQLLDAVVERNLRDHQAIEDEIMGGLGVDALAFTGADRSSLLRTYTQRAMRAYFARPEVALVRHEVFLYAARHESMRARLSRWRSAYLADLAGRMAILGARHPMAAARMVSALADGLIVQQLSVPDDELVRWATQLMLTATEAALPMPAPAEPHAEPAPD